MDGEREDQRGPGDGRRVGDGTADAARQAKRDRFVAEISGRLRHICHHLTDEEFARLVVDMADMKLRFNTIDASAWAVRRPPVERRPDDVGPNDEP